MRRMTWFLLAGLLLPVGMNAAETAAKIDMPDSFIEERKKMLDKVAAKRSEEAAKEATELQSLMNKQKQERAAFDKKQISERREFLTSLKKMEDKKRRSAFNAFNNQQERDRRKFFSDQEGAIYNLQAQFKKKRSPLTAELEGEKAKATSSASSGSRQNMQKW